MPGWLGGASADEYTSLLHSDARIQCHVHTNQQCTGAAIYRANVVKTSRDPKVLRLPPNKGAVFASPVEFLKHHKKD